MVGIASTLIVNRCQDLSKEFNDRVSSVRTNDCVMVFTDYCCQGLAIQVYDIEELSDFPVDRRISSVSPCGYYRAPFPKEIIETWDGHGEIMTQVAEIDDVGLYYSDPVIKGGQVLEQVSFLGQVWRYTKHRYGDFGPEGGPLFAFFHASSIPLGFSGRLYVDSDAKCRNTVDVFSDSPVAWSASLTEDERDVVVCSVGRIVEWSSKGVYYNPAWGKNVWGENIDTLPWKEIFVFDVYNGLGMVEDASRTYNKYLTTSHNDPQPNTFWFKNWFFPIYEKYGGSRVLNNYFETLSRHFPRTVYELEWSYDRQMNLGEFVHFFSGAVGVNLREQAKLAFDWTTEYETDFVQAQHDFPRVKYVF